jgi:hypothetical protein
MQKHSRYIESYEHKFSEMREHMFYGETLERLSRFVPEARKKPEIIKSKIRQGVRVAGLAPAKAERKTSFLCSQRDRLFWSFFVVLKGTKDFLTLGQHSFSEEKKFKFDSVELMRKKAPQFKAAKVSLNQAESEMVNSREITIVGMEALCIAYEVSLIYIVGNSYYDFNYGDKYHVIERVDSGCAVLQDVTDTKITETRETLFLIDRQKPLKGISSYMIGDLQAIAKRLNVHTVTETGKPLTKKALYEALVVMTGKLQQMT